MSEREIQERLKETYPRFIQNDRGWVLETAPNRSISVPNPDDKLAYVAQKGRFSKAQLRDLQLATLKRMPVPPDPSAIFHLEQLIEAAG